MSHAAAFYHRTSAERAARIIKEGFKDAAGTYGTDRIHHGVLLFDQPVHESDGQAGDTLLVVEMPRELIEAYEWPTAGQRYHIYLVPSVCLNGRAKIRVMDDDKLPTQIKPRPV